MSNHKHIFTYKKYLKQIISDEMNNKNKKVVSDDIYYKILNECCETSEKHKRISDKGNMYYSINMKQLAVSVSNKYIK